jgi:hypothetical protein
MEPQMKNTIRHYLSFLVFVLLVQLNVACVAQPDVMGVEGGGIFECGSSCSMQKIKEYTVKLEDIKRELTKIAELVEKAAGYSVRYKKEAKGFAKVVDFYINELSTCEKMEAEYRMYNLINNPPDFIKTRQQQKLEACAKRVDESTIEQTFATDFLKNLQERVKNLTFSADMNMTEAKSLEASRQTIEARIEWFNSRLQH